MTENWELDGRQMPDQVLEYLRKIAVRAVKEYGYSPEVVIKVLGLSRSCMYEWLKRYETRGLKGLEGHPAPGAEAQVTEAMEAWLKETVLQSTPVESCHRRILRPASKPPALAVPLVWLPELLPRLACCASFRQSHRQPEG